MTERGYCTSRFGTAVPAVVVWLGSRESASVTGRVFDIEGGRITLVDGWNDGPTADKHGRWEPEEIGPTVPVIAVEGKVRFRGEVNRVLFERLIAASGRA